MKNLGLLFALGVVLLGPIVLRQRSGESMHGGAESLVIITPHNEAIRHEFGRAFAGQHFQRTGETVRMDFRTPGGTTEITRYIQGNYVAAFENYWVHILGRPWSATVQKSFANAKVKLDDTPADDTDEEQARRAFLDSDVSCKIDVFFGGGAYDFSKQADAGYLVDFGLIENHPELFGPNGAIPQSVGGEPFWDPKGRWIGTVISAFGIVSNLDSLRRLGIEMPPKRWADLADPRYLHEIALANPTQSGSVAKSFEMIIQQQIQEALAAPGAKATPAADDAIAAGWTRAMQLLQRVGANARYFTDASTKIALDVTSGECAAGMTIDFYGRYQSQAVANTNGDSYVHYVDAVGGTSFGVDPIGIYRGAPHPKLAREFVEFVMSTEGQKLWNWKVGAPGGPEHYALRRPPILPSLYDAELNSFRSDPDVMPYEAARKFTYHPEWTGPLFGTISFIFRVMCIDPHHEQVRAWSAIIKAGLPPEALAEFAKVGAVDYAAAQGRIRDALGGTKIGEVELARELADHFREQYRRAEALARAGR